MEVRDFLTYIAGNYDRHLGMGTDAQHRLRHAGEYIGDNVPAGIIVRGGGGQTTPTETPFVALLDPDETTRPSDGIYAVYLFASDLATVFLSLNQGITALTEQMGQAAARERLAKDAAVIRNHLPADDINGLATQIDLKSKGRAAAKLRGGEHCGVRVFDPVTPTRVLHPRRLGPDVRSVPDRRSDEARAASSGARVDRVRQRLAAGRPERSVEALPAEGRFRLPSAHCWEAADEVSPARDHRSSIRRTGSHKELRTLDNRASARLGSSS
jgi:hypothetical protein